MPLCISRAQAIIEGLTRYYTGKPCKHGHLTERMTSGRSCVKCNRLRDSAYAKANREKKYAKHKAWYTKNRERELEKLKSRSKEWYARNKEKRLAKGSEWERTHKAERTAWRREYNKENPHVAAGGKARRRNKEKFAVPAWLTPDHKREINDIYKTAKVFGMEVDHIIPLQGLTVSGLHVPWNLQLLTRAANAKKSNKL